jgi:hypothetical protein
MDDAASLRRTSTSQVLEKSALFDVLFTMDRNVLSMTINKLTRLTNPYRSCGSSDPKTAGNLFNEVWILIRFCC